MEQQGKDKLLNWHKVMNQFSVIAFDHGTINVNGEKRKAERYTIGAALSEEQRKWISKFNNVKLSTAHYRYAPEIKYPVIYILLPLRNAVQTQSV